MSDNKVSYSTEKIEFSREYLLSGKWVKEISMREPKFDDEMNIAEIEPMLQNPTMFANLCDITVDEMRQIAGIDMKKVSKAYESFLS